MTTVSALGAAATVVATAFAMCTASRWMTRRRPHELAWTQSLFLFALASFAYWWGGATGWNAVNFRLFYLFGAIVNVPYLAVGTAYLLGGPTVGRRAHNVVHAFAAFSAGAVIAAPAHDIPATGLPQGREIFGMLPRVLAAVGSGVGATVLIVGAIWSAVRLAIGRDRRATAPGATNPLRLVLTNVAIAVGSLILGAGGALFTDDQQEVGFGILLVSGIVVLFAGFLVTPAAPATSARDEVSPFLSELHLLADRDAA